MNHEENHRSSRLQFTKEERDEPTLQKPIRRAEKAAGKLEDAQAKIPQRKAIVKERTVDADTGKKTVRLHFADVEKRKPGKLTHVLTDAPVAEAHRQIAKSEEDNVGVEAAHKTEQGAETGYRVGRSVAHVQRLTIHYNCIGSLAIPDMPSLPPPEVTVQTRKGVAVSYAAMQEAV